MRFLGLGLLGGLSVWVAVGRGRGIAGARFNRALRTYARASDAAPERVDGAHSDIIDRSIAFSFTDRMIKLGRAVYRCVPTGRSRDSARDSRRRVGPVLAVQLRRR